MQKRSIALFVTALSLAASPVVASDAVPCVQGTATIGPGSGSAPAEPPAPHPSSPTDLVIDVDIYAGDEKVDDRTVGVDRALTLRAELWSRHGDAADGAVSDDIDRVETDFFVSLDKVNWTRVGSRQYTKLSNLKKSSPARDDGHVEKVVVGPFGYQVGTVLYAKACVDTEDEIRERDESNNCDTEKVTLVDPPYVDLVGHSLSVIQYPRYAGDHIRLRAAVSNIGTGAPRTGIRSVYQARCPGTGWVTLADDGTPASELAPGATEWEEIHRSVAMPDAVGTCTLQWCVDYRNAVAEYSESNNCVTTQVSLAPRPAPDLAVEWVRDKKGCCTTKRKKKLYPKAGIANYGEAAPTRTVEVRYFLKGPGTGGNWWDLGNVDHLPPHELRPGARREEKIGRGWRVPKRFGKGWHEVRVCINTNPWGTGRIVQEKNYANNCKSYWRYIK